MKSAMGKFIALLIFSTVGFGAAADCIIYASACPMPSADASPYPGWRREAHSDAHTCFRRARDWQNYCGRGGYVYAYFGKTVGAFDLLISVTSTNSYLYVHTLGGAFLPIQNSY